MWAQVPLMVGCGAGHSGSSTAEYFQKLRLAMANLYVLKGGLI
jgi:hypothetical protein